MPIVNGLRVIGAAGEPDTTGADRGPAPTAIDVVLVHGSLDRAESFRRVLRRLAPVPAVAYDRRGYAGSRRAGPPAGLAGQVDDLLALLEVLAPDRPVALVGHSYGGDVVVGAALAAPERVSAVGAYEPPMPWLGFRRTTVGPDQGDGPIEVGEDGAVAVADPPGQQRPWPAIAEDPGEEAERFYRRMVSDTAWERLSEGGRAAIRADGPALVADLRSIRSPAPYDVTALSVPSVWGRGGRHSAPHHRATVAWLATAVPGAARFDIDGARHGAHFTHPDAFAAFVRATISAGRPPGGVR